jgi:hypothetical protein
MNKILLNSLLVGLTAGCTLLTASAAQALQLRADLWEAFNETVNAERLAIPNSQLGLIDINPEALKVLSSKEPIEAYFINEGAYYRNELAFSANGSDPTVIFEDASSPDSIMGEADGPLALGEGRTLGTFDAGTQLDFFLTPTNPANGNQRRTLYTDSSLNKNGLQHYIAKAYFDAVDKQWWTLIGIEDNDASNSDRDFNDTVFAIKGLADDSIDVDVPEPASLLGLLGVAALGASQLRRRDS